jgi:ribosomal protein L37AE/L43A
MLAQEPVKLSEVRIHKRCPECSRPIVRREASQDGDLWVLREMCDDCTWTTEIEDVKIGA